MTLRQSFFEATKLSKIWNTTIKWNGYILATVQWHEDREWKVVDTDDFETIAPRAYEPIAEFHTQKELWEYIKKQETNN